MLFKEIYNYIVNRFANRTPITENDTIPSDEETLNAINGIINDVHDAPAPIAAEMVSTTCVTADTAVGTPVATADAAVGTPVATADATVGTPVTAAGAAVGTPVTTADAAVGTPGVTADAAVGTPGINADPALSTPAEISKIWVVASKNEGNCDTIGMADVVNQTDNSDNKSNGCNKDAKNASFNSTYFTACGTDDCLIRSAGLHMIARAVRSSGIGAKIDAAVSFNTCLKNYSTEDIITAYCCCIARGDIKFEKIDDLNGMEKILGFEESIPSKETVRQRIDEIGAERIEKIVADVNVNYLKLCKVVPTAYKYDLPPLDIDVTPCINEKNKKEGIGMTYKKKMG